MAYPPAQADIIEPFIQWLNKKQNAMYEIVARPDETERQQQAIDYVLQNETRQHEVAVEVSTVWRSGPAGREDYEWSQWTERVRAAARGELSGEYHVWTPLQAPHVDPVAFGDELVIVVKARAGELARLVKDGKGADITVKGIPIHVSLATDSGSDVSFARDGGPMTEAEFTGFVLDILDKKVPKLKDHKASGRETWLLLYNTVWTVFQVGDYIERLIAERHAPLDHIAVVCGNPPHDCWVEEVWHR